MGKQLKKKDLEKYSEITDVTFDHEGAHLAVCHALQQSANGYTGALITKSEDQDTELIKALEQIQVTMSMEEYLIHFFNLWYDDAEFLTKLMGMETEREYMETEEGEGMRMMEDESYHDYMMRYMDMKLEKVEILRSCKDLQYKDLTEDQLATCAPVLSEFIKGIAKDQEGFAEKIAELEKNKAEVTKTEADSSTSTASAEEEKAETLLSSDSDVNKTSGKTTNIEDTIVATKKDQVKAAEAVVKDAAVDTEALEKAQAKIADTEAKLAETEAKLEKAAEAEAKFEKAMAQLEALEKAEQARIEKSLQNFTDTLSFADADMKEGIVKTLMGVNDEAAKVIFSALEKAQEALVETVEKEVGVDGEVGIEKKGDVLKDMIAQKYADKKFA